MGTGIGGAVVVAGELLAGNGGAGDFGHAAIEVDGRRCVCGGTGCLEQYVSGRILAAAAERGAADNPELARRRAGRPLHAGDLQDAAVAGDPRAIAELDAAARAFAAGLRTVVAALDPTRIVLAGALLAEGTDFGRRVRDAWYRRRPSWCHTPLLHVPADEDAALRGAARLVQAR
jgi:glucokinase